MQVTRDLARDGRAPDNSSRSLAMHLLANVASGFEPAPAWWVTNGAQTVGPVATDLLVRGILTGKIPDHCRVCPADGGDWRTLDEVREVRAARSGVAPKPPSGVREVLSWLLEARESSEALLLALHGACAMTQASIGALYRVRAPLALPVVSACYGDPLLELGEVVPRVDPALRLAHEGEPTVLRPGTSAAARAIATRLCPNRELLGIALIPIRTPTEIAGVVELGRFDHPFRTSDVRALVPLMTATAARLEELSWEP